MTALEEIKSQLDVDMSKGITTVDRLRIIAGGVPDFDPITVEDAEWIISALERLQRENKELRHRLKAPEPDLTCPHIDKLVETGDLSIEAIHELYHIRDINSMLRYGLWHEKSRAEAAEAEVKRQADSLSWYRSGSFAHAINEHLSSAGISVNGDIIHDCIQRSALSAQVQDVAEGWSVISNHGSVLIYCLKQNGWRKGEPVMVNDVTIRIENAAGSNHDLTDIADAIIRSLPAAPAKQEVGE